MSTASFTAIDVVHMRMGECMHVRVGECVPVCAGEGKTMAGHDAVFAQLMGMGFDPEAIEDCQVAMATSSESFSLQAATEWSETQSVVLCCTCFTSPGTTS